MTPIYRSVIVTVIINVAVFGASAVVRGHSEYPWIHHFEQPERRSIHRAFPDGQGSIIVATGDWNDSEPYLGLIIHWYRSSGVYRINCDHISLLASPDSCYVLDGAVDSDGRTWVIYGEGDYYFTDPPFLAGEDGGSIGYYVPGPGFSVSPIPQGPVRNTRLGLIDSGGLVEQSELTHRIPGEFYRMNADTSGKVIVISKENSEKRMTSAPTKFYLSWWEDCDVDTLRTISLSNASFLPEFFWGYVGFGPDGQAYLLARSLDAPWDPGLYCVDTLTGDWEVLSRLDHPLLDSEFVYFHVDSANRKWFGTDDGLVLLDGENWSRFTTENSDLPHNRVCQMAYDPVDDVYYVATQAYAGAGRYASSFTILTRGGSPVTSLDFGRAASPSYFPNIWEGASDVSFLCPPPEVSSDTYIIYSYDHERVLHWNTADWFGHYSYIGCVGATSTQRTFCVFCGRGPSNPLGVMIW